MTRFLRTLFVCVGLLCSGSLLAQNNSSTCAPNMRFASILNKLEITSGGRLLLGQMLATCLPEPSRKGNSIYPYDPDDGGKFSIVLKNAKGQMLTTYVWSVEKITSLWELKNYKVVGGEAMIKSLVPGDYVLEFAVEDKPFHRFPFSVATKKSEDIYDPGTIYLLNGAWEEYGIFYYYKPDRYSQFFVWLRDTGKPRNQAVPVELKLLRKSDGRLLAMNRPGEAVKLKAAWNMFKLSFNPVTETGELTNAGEFHASEILKTDGAYVVTLALDGKPYGQYELVVKGGQIQALDRQVRPAANPLEHIEDVNNSWWLKRKQ